VIGLEVNADKYEYMVIALFQNGGRRHNVKIQNTSFEREEHFKNLGTTLRKRNSIKENRSKSFGVETFIVQITTNEYRD